MIRLAAHAVATLVVMLLLDAPYLGLVAARDYREVLGDTMLPSFRPVPAVLFYLVYATALAILAEDALGASFGGAGTMPSIGMIAARGAVFGFAAYATYDLTNLATLRPWTTALAVKDLCWGTFLSAAASGLGAWAARAALRALG